MRTALAVITITKFYQLREIKKGTIRFLFLLGDKIFYLASTFVAPHRSHSNTVTSLPSFTSNFLSVLIFHLWKPLLQSVLPLCFSKGDGRLNGKTLVIRFQPH